MAHKGMPSLLEDMPDVTDVIVRNIEAGHTREYAAIMAGVPYQTFQTWMRRGKANDTTKDGLYVKFYLRVRDADRAARQRWRDEALARLGKAGAGENTETIEEVIERDGVITKRVQVKRLAPNPSIDQWLLKHRHPEEFGDDAEKLRELFKWLAKMKEEQEGKGADDKSGAE